MLLGGDGVLTIRGCDYLQIGNAQLNPDGGAFVLPDHPRYLDRGLLNQLIRDLKDLRRDIFMKDNTLNDTRPVSDLEEV